MPETRCSGLSFQRLNDHLHHAILVLQYLIVPEAQYTKILGAQPSITLSISVRSVGVLASVNLNDQTRVEARKVDNVPANRNLLAKAMTIDVLAPKEVPE